MLHPSEAGPKSMALSRTDRGYSSPTLVGGRVRAHERPASLHHEQVRVCVRVCAQRVEWCMCAFVRVECLQEECV